MSTEKLDSDFESFDEMKKEVISSYEYDCTCGCSCGFPEVLMTNAGTEWCSFEVKQDRDDLCIIHGAAYFLTLKKLVKEGSTIWVNSYYPNSRPYCNFFVIHSDEIMDITSEVDMLLDCDYRDSNNPARDAISDLSLALFGDKRKLQFKIL